ncbi:hypothetical protein [Streptomyces sp. IGB124]|uniref:hypothetical protein n=1 Tax=Streptomyces sp. IGB124 TaxID=1519485 RepID=UPI000B04CD3A|nr:hypothetical protein [Streptomyces sp. IGB124]
MILPKRVPGEALVEEALLPSTEGLDLFRPAVAPAVPRYGRGPRSMAGFFAAEGPVRP